MVSHLWVYVFVFLCTGFEVISLLCYRDNYIRKANCIGQWIQKQNKKHSSVSLYSACVQELSRIKHYALQTYRLDNSYFPLHVLFPNIYFSSRQPRIYRMGRTHIVLFNPAMRGKKVVFYLQLMSYQTEFNMQQDSCFRHLGYQTHIIDNLCLTGTSFEVERCQSYVWLLDHNSRTTPEHILAF